MAAEGHVPDTQAAEARTPPTAVPNPLPNPSTASSIAPSTLATPSTAEFWALLLQRERETALLTHPLDSLEQQETARSWTRRSSRWRWSRIWPPCLVARRTARKATTSRSTPTSAASTTTYNARTASPAATPPPPAGLKSSLRMPLTQGKRSTRSSRHPPPTCRKATTSKSPGPPRQ